MRRSTRNGDLTVHSDQIPESHDATSSSPTTGFWDDPSLPKFRFIQSSPHSGVLNVNGEVETVHWVVKDRPFAIRILEVPFARGEEINANHRQEGGDSVEFANWNEIEVRSDVVFTKTRKPVKMPSASEKSALSVDQSVIPASVYNHRRSANLMTQQAYAANSNLESSASASSHYASSSSSSSSSPGSLLLKGGSGIELSVRLAVLSSHVRNDFCVHVQLVLRGQLIAEWFSETIKSVSKWDKVRQLQDTSATTPKSHYNRSSSTPSNRNVLRSQPAPTSAIAITPTPIIGTTRNHAKRSLLQASQKPVSSSIKPSIDDPLTSAPDTESFTDAPATSRASPNTMDQDVASTEVPSRISRAKSAASAAAAAAASQRSSSSLSLDYMTAFDDEHSVSSSSGKNGKKKKASGEEVFEMLERLQRVQQEMALLIQHQQPAPANRKKRAATWEPTAEASGVKSRTASASNVKPAKIASVYPSESEAAEGARLALEQAKASAQTNKKTKRFEAAVKSEVHRLAPPAEVTNNVKSGELAKNVHRFLDLLDQSVLAHVRSALQGLLLTRPDLSAILQRMMTDTQAPHHQSDAGDVQMIPSANSTSATSTDISSAPTVASWSQADQIPMLNQSGFLWTDDRYENGQSEGVRGLGEMEMQMDTEIPPASDEHHFVPSHPAESAQQHYYEVSVMSPYDLDEESMDDSTTMGSPSYAAWSDEWSATEPSSPSFPQDSSTSFRDSTSSPHHNFHPQNPSLTDSTMMFSGFAMETPAGF